MSIHVVPCVCVANFLACHLFPRVFGFESGLKVVLKLIEGGSCSTDVLQQL